MATKSPTNILEELKRIFLILNKSLFHGDLQPVPFTIQTKKKISLRWMLDAKAIVLGADFPKLEYSEVLSVLTHEMIHVLNYQAGTQDVTTNQYHNKTFLEGALSVGFYVIKHKTQGWSITSTIYPRNVVDKFYIKRPDKELVKIRNTAFESAVLDQSLFNAGRLDIRDRIRSEKPVKTYFLKYECNCPPPHNSIRSGRRPDGPNALNIQCMNCKSQFECVTELEE